MAWNRWLTVIPSQPEEGLFFSDLIALITLLSFIVRFGLEKSNNLPVQPNIVQPFA